MQGIHHAAIVTADVDAALRFWRDGLGFTELFDHTFTGDWTTLFEADTDQLRSIFLGDPENPETGHRRTRRAGGKPSGAGAARRSGVRILLALAATRRRHDAWRRWPALGFDDGVRRIDMPAPGGKRVDMAVINAPDGVRVELIGPPR